MLLVAPRWLAQHEGLPLRGAAAELPAAVREITESRCYSAPAPEFWLVGDAYVVYVCTRIHVVMYVHTYVVHTYIHTCVKLCG